MIKSLLIRNFRIFKEIEIKKLSRVNLFVGKNNSGKSCLIEALQIYATKGNPKNLYEIVSNRDEDWENIIAEKNETSVQEVPDPFSYIFNGYSLPEIGGESIEIGPTEDASKRLKINLRAFQIIEDEEGRRRRVPVEQDSIKDELVDIQIALETIQGDDRFHYIALNSHIPSYKRRIYSGPKDSNINHQVVPTRNISDDKLSVLWDNINLTDLENDVVSCLKIIDPNIEGVALIGDVSERSGRKSKRIPIIRYKGLNERIPLKTMGDGLTRLFHIILALVNSKNGFLLIDEFENGLHWTTHPKIWDIIIRLSEQLNVQIIATTHSRDCIKGFYEVWSSKEECASFYRLEADHLKGPKIINYTCEMLSDAIESGVEVR
ncbi:MAG: AAA family ATPase [Candidatus Cloacimonadota bacterium]|nr:AAA family ATPase [Candidatus Cloacimonadota bacterium]